MFAKLLKYEFKKSKGVLGIMTLAMLGLALLVTIYVKFAVITTSNGGELSDPMTVLMIPVIVAPILGLIAYIVCAFIVPLVQFYKSSFTDEGYLTFTLPTTPHHIFLASLTNMLIWQVVSLVTIILSFLIVIFLGTSPDQFFNTAIITGYREVISDPTVSMVWQEMTSMMGLNTISSLAWVANLIVSTLSSLVLAATAVVIGCTVAKKHKGWASIGFYFLLSYGVSSLSSSLTMNTATQDLVNLTTDTEIAAYMGQLINSSLITGLVIQLVILVGGYILSTWLMKRKLNLP